MACVREVQDLLLAALSLVARGEDLDRDVDRLISCIVLLLDLDKPGVVEEIRLLIPMVAKDLSKRRALAKALRDPASLFGNRRQEVTELLVMHLIKERNRLASYASDQKEMKEGTWNYAVGGSLGGGFAATVAVATGTLAMPLVPAMFFVGAAVAWNERRRAHRRFQAATDTAAEFDALQGDLVRKL